MKYKEIRQLAPEKMVEDIASATDELRKLRFAHAISPIQNPLRIQHTRRHIARLRTAYRAHAIEAAKPQNHVEKS